MLFCFVSTFHLQFSSYVQFQPQTLVVFLTASEFYSSVGSGTLVPDICYPVLSSGVSSEMLWSISNVLPLNANTNSVAFWGCPSINQKLFSIQLPRSFPIKFWLIIFFEELRSGHLSNFWVHLSKFVTKFSLDLLDFMVHLCFLMIKLQGTCFE